MAVEELCDVQLECRTSGPSFVTWFKTSAGCDVTINSHDQYQIFTDQGTLHRLVITSVTKDDAGIYKCSVDAESTEAELFVAGERKYMLDCLKRLSLVQGLGFVYI